MDAGQSCRHALAAGGLGSTAMQDWQQRLTVRDRFAAANGAPEEWGGGIDVAILDTGRLLEGAFCMRCSRTLLVSDNCVLVGGLPGRRVLGSRAQQERCARATEAGFRWRIHRHLHHCSAEGYVEIGRSPWQQLDHQFSDGFIGPEALFALACSCSDCQLVHRAVYPHVRTDRLVGASPAD